MLHALFLKISSHVHYSDRKFTTCTSLVDNVLFASQTMCYMLHRQSAICYMLAWQTTCYLFIFGRQRAMCTNVEENNILW